LIADKYPRDLTAIGAESLVVGAHEEMAWEGSASVWILIDTDPQRCSLNVMSGRTQKRVELNVREVTSELALHSACLDRDSPLAKRESLKHQEGRDRRVLRFHSLVVNHLASVREPHDGIGSRGLPSLPVDAIFESDVAEHGSHDDARPPKMSRSSASIIKHTAAAFLELAELFG